MRVIILHPSEPNAQTRAALEDPRFDQRVQYVRGSPLRNRDLGSAAVYDAKAVFVISTGRTNNPMLSDATCLLTVRIIKTTSPWVPVYCELNVPQSTSHTWADWDHLVCAQDLKYALLAKSAVVPGFSTFIANLLTSSSTSQHVNLARLDPSDRKWLREYTRGASQELYCLPFAPAFSKQFFSVASHIAYVLWGVLIIGVETQRTRRRTSIDQILNAGNEPIETRAKNLAVHQARLIGLVRTS